MTKRIEIKEFAIRVERLCDFLIFLINKTKDIGVEGRRDLQAIQDLKEEAADIQFEYDDIPPATFEGLFDYMRKGADIAPKESEESK